MVFDVKNYSIEPGVHKGKNVIWIAFPYNQQLINDLKQNTTAQWSQGSRKWLENSAGCKYSLA